MVKTKNAAVALFESLCVTFEDVEEFLDKSIVVPDKDVAIPHISVDGDAFVVRGRPFFLIRHGGLWRGVPRFFSIIRQE